MCGTIQAESEPGKGSLFAFELPLRCGAPVVRPAASLDPRGMRALLVDDNPMVRSVLADMLQSLDFAVSVAASGSEALAALHEPGAHYGLVLLDWRMPGMDGEETARRIRTELGDERPLVIMMTAYGRQAMDQDVGSDALDGFLVKPLTPSLLLDAVVDAHGARRGEVAAAVDTRPVDEPVAQLRGRVLVAEDNEIN